LEHLLGLDESALAAEVDAGLEGRHRSGHALDGIAGNAESVLHHGHVASGAALEQHRERTLRLRDVTGFTEVGARYPAVAERACALRQRELLGECEGAIDGHDRVSERAPEE
jgi:hypothetical protein